MKPVYFLLATFLCLLIIITHGNSDPVAQKDPPKSGTGDGNDVNGANNEDNKNDEQVKPEEPSPKPGNITEPYDNTLGSLADPATMKRMLYVLLGFTTLVVAFFAFKTIRSISCISVYYLVTTYDNQLAILIKYDIIKLSMI